MVQVISKLSPIPVTCIDYVHPWTNSCLDASAGLYLYCLYDSLRIYGTVYSLALLMRGKVPSFQDIRRTFAEIMQSTAFLSATGLGYSAFLCSLRKTLGNFNILSVSSLPVFLSSIFAIQIERSSRRPMLCLYVSNVATETVWNMMESRGMVKSIPHAPTIIYSLSMALLLMYYKGGQHKAKEGGKSDSIFKIIRYMVGPYEENEFLQKRSEQMTNYNRQTSEQITSTSPQAGYSMSRQVDRPKNTIFHLINQALRVYRRFIHKIKCCGRHIVCPHPFSCIFYTLQGTTKMFSTGLGIQVVIKLLFNVNTIFTKPSSIKKIFFKRDVFALASFLAGFTGIFRAVSCSLRWMTGKDNQYHALIAGLLAGTTFTRYSDTTISLYVFWKALQITYNLGIQSGHLPKVSGFTEFLYCFSTAILFHAAIVEPTNLRPSYYKFLHNLSGGRISSMNRSSLDAWGLETTRQTMHTLNKTKNQAIVKYIM